jgi:glucose-1-phosphate cytidylyltransferase
MKVVILAGGLGTRLAEETDRIPKPMVTIGEKPVLWHIMKHYAQHGLNEFIICAGYKASVIIEYFANYRLHNSNITVDLARNVVTPLSEPHETWKVSVIQTGEGTETGGRLLRVADHLTPGEPFLLTYGDGVSDVDVGATIRFHQQRSFRATMTAVRPPPRFGAPIIEDGRVTRFSEKTISNEAPINGGFFVLEHSVLELIGGDRTVWEHEPLQIMTKEGQLGAYLHDGFWHPMDTLRDRRYLEQLWASGTAPWKTWKV